MPRAGLKALGVRQLHVAELLARLGERRRHIAFFDVHMERVPHDEHGCTVDGVAEARRVRERHAHVVLVAVERLDEDARAGTLGTFRERAQASEEERFVLLACATGSDAREIARASPDRHDDDARAKLAREIEERGDVGPRGGDLVWIRIDQPTAVASRDRGDRDFLADRGARFVERRTFRELERVETKAPRGVVFLAERRARNEAILNADPRHEGAWAIVVFISATSTQARRRALTIAASAKRTWRNPSAKVGNGTGDGFPSSVP